MQPPQSKLLIFNLRLCGILTLLVLLVPTQHASARAPNPNTALARKHFEAAETHYELGQFKKALAEYQKAHSYKRFAAFVFNIAQCHRQLKQWNQALFKYRLYLSKKPNASNRAEVLRRIKQMAKQAALQAAAQRAYGKLTVITRPAGAQVLINKLKGTPDGISPFIRKIKAGTYLLAIQSKGFRSVHRQVVITTGKMTLVDVTLAPLVKPRPVEPRRTVDPVRRLAPGRPTERRTTVGRPLQPRSTPGPIVHQSSPYYKRWWFWAGLALAATAAGGGIAFGVKALKFSDEWKEAKGLLLQEDHLEQGLEARRNADIMLGTSAAVTLAVIIGALIVGMDRAERPDRPDRPGSTHRTLVLPSCTAQGCGLTLTGRF